MGDIRKNFTTQHHILGQVGRTTVSAYGAAGVSRKAIMASPYLAVVTAPVLECSNPRCDGRFPVPNIARLVTITHGLHTQYCDTCHHALPTTGFLINTTQTHKEVATSIGRHLVDDVAQVNQQLLSALKERFDKDNPRQLAELAKDAMGVEHVEDRSCVYRLRIPLGSPLSWTSVTEGTGLETMERLLAQSLYISWFYEVIGRPGIGGLPEHYVLRFRLPDQSGPALGPVQELAVPWSLIEEHFVNNK